MRAPQKPWWAEVISLIRWAARSGWAITLRVIALALVVLFMLAVLFVLIAAVRSPGRAERTPTASDGVATLLPATW